MPKKFVGENSKATAAKARKSAAKEVETAKRQQQLEEDYWKEDDKHVRKKQQKKDELERKKQQQLEKKAESKALYEQEMNNLQSTGSKPQPKLTRAQIQTEAEKQAAPAASKKPEITHVQKPLEENINRVLVEGTEARTIDEAIAVLSLKEEDVDRHPEKRLKAAFTAFEEINMPRIKADNPNLRLSQLKQILRKEWIKSPENPLNQRLSLNK